MIRRPVATSRAPICLVLTMFAKIGIFGPKMGVAATRPMLGTGSSGPPQKFRHMSFFFGQLLSQNQVSQKIWVEPPPPPPKKKKKNKLFVGFTIEEKTSVMKSLFSLKLVSSTQYKNKILSLLF